MLPELFFLLSHAIMILYTFRHYVFSFAAIKHRSENQQSQKQNQHTIFQPHVSIIIPARNEEKVIERLLRRLTELKYLKDKLEIIVMNDQSTDRTGKIAETYASENPEFIKVVHRKIGGVGKAAVLNEGLHHALGEIIGFFDADYIPQRDILEKTLPHFLDPKVGVVQGRISVFNERQSLVSRIVALERLGGYRVSQYARDLYGLIPQFAGTVGFIRRELLLFLGGFNTDTLAEDTDLTFRITLAGYKIKYANSAESSEEAVNGWRQYWRQRKRWAKGHMQCAFNYVFPLLKSRTIPLKRKVDGLLLLNVYFLPILVIVSWILWLAVLIFKLPTLIPFEIAFVSSVFFFLHGNLAPFIEVIAGALCDRRLKLISLTWLLVLSYLINVVICSTAFVELLAYRINGKNPNHWHKTMHNGEG